jgi:tRNA pseudouridine55 synthase
VAKSNLFGILNINKPKGITSFDVIARLRKILNIKQIGHSGTLDPIAQGVLAICVGDATRIIEFLPSDKSYRAFAQLGFNTNTYDLEGEVISKKEVNVTKEQIETALSTFSGEIEQLPPIFSAIKIKGKKLYEYARKNEAVEIPKRTVNIYKIELVEFKNDIIVFDVDCSSGTYIRSIINDLGEKLGCGATMIDLVRTKASGLSLENSQNLDEITAENAKFIDPLEELTLNEIKITQDQLNKIKLGQYFMVEKFISETVKLSFEGKLVAIAKMDENKVRPKKVFAV